jgi:hypothetical protein
LVDGGEAEVAEKGKSDVRGKDQYFGKCMHACPFESLVLEAQVLGHHSVGKSGKIISALIEFHHHEYIADKKNVSSYNFFRTQLFLNLW